MRRASTSSQLAPRSPARPSTREGQAGHEQRSPAVPSADAGDDVGKLQSDQHEGEAVEDERQRPPNGVDLDSDVWRKESGALPAQVESGRDDREDSGGAQLLTGEIGGVGDEDADGELDRRVVDLHLDPFDDAADHEPDADPAGGEPQKPQ